MKYLHGALLVVLVWIGVETALTVRELRRIPARVEQQIALTRKDLMAAIADAEDRAEREIASTRSALSAQLDLTRVGLLARVDAAGVSLDARAAEIQQQAVQGMSRIAETASTAASLLEDARPGVQAWAKLSPALAANTLGTVAAVKVTAGQAAQTMREIERATPDLLASVRVSALASQQAAQSAAQTAQNMAAITNPGPRWLRFVGVGATVAVPAAQVALPMAVLAK